MFSYGKMLRIDYDDADFVALLWSLRHLKELESFFYQRIT